MTDTEPNFARRMLNAIDRSAPPINLEAIAARNANSGMLNSLGRKLATAHADLARMKEERDRLADNAAACRVMTNEAEAEMRRWRARALACQLVMILGALALVFT